MPDIVRDYPGMQFTSEGEAREQQESLRKCLDGVPFRAFHHLLPIGDSFSQLHAASDCDVGDSLGLGGAILGHIIMGQNLSIMSVFGMLALSGVVVNDSLVLVDYINRKRREGNLLLDAVRTAGVARFRAIMLTSFTTFAGLIPIMWEKSTQAQFLIPMAISLGWGSFSQRSLPY